MSHPAGGLPCGGARSTMIAERLTTHGSERIARERRDRYWKHRDYADNTGGNDE